MDQDGPITYSQFGCIGAGFAGIALGATLQRWYGITDLRIFERHSDLGGTWFVNKYPGAACDVPAALYSFSFAPSGGWTRVLPERDELWAYIKKVADEYDLPKRITLGTKVERCTWDEQRKVWRMRVRHVETGQFLTHECQFLFAGTGQLAEPRKPDLPGIDNFKGPVFSATWWRDDVDLTDKRVVVFGNGCTGCQIVPAIADRCKQVTHVVRSKHWIAPPTDSPVIEQTRFLLNTVPGLLSLLRLLVFTIAESAFPAFQMDKAGTRNRQRRQAKVERYMRKAAPAEYHDLLIPDFQFGCKRRIFDPGYLPSLHRPNVTLTGAAVEELTPGGVRFENGEVVEADVVVLATGYATGQYFHGMDIIGREGSIQEHWKQFGGPEAYNCSAVNGFPNFTMILGPNSATGHTSAVMAIENTINFGLRAIKPVLDGAAETVEVSREAEERYSQKMQAVLRGMVWETGCGSWYVKKNADGTEWNSHTYPWGQARLWYDSVFLRKKDFVYTGIKSKRVVTIGRLLRLLAVTASLVVLVNKVAFLRQLGCRVASYFPWARPGLAYLKNAVAL